MEQRKSLLTLYLERNLVTMPVNMDKIPIHKKWTRFTLSDSKQLTYDSNIGILTGSTSGILVIDVDNKVPELTYKTVKYSTNTGVTDWESLILQHGEPITPKVQTASGGFHYYFKYTDHVSHLKSKSNAVSINGTKAAIDLKTNGGYVVAPPSQHRNGKHYTWTRHLTGTPMIEVPTWLLQYLSPHKTQHIHLHPHSHTLLFSNLSLQPQPPASQITFEQLSNTINNIPDHVSDDYNDWVNIMMAIYNVSHENHINPLQRDLLIHQFSKKSSKYTPFDVDYKISTFHYDPSGLKLGTILSKAKRKEEDANSIDIEYTIDNFSQNTVANLIYQYMKTEYIYQDENGWYDLRENKRWKHTRSVPTRMRNHVSKMITKVYQDHMRNMDMVNVDPKERERRIERQKLLLKQLKQSGSISFIEGVIEFMKHLYHDHEETVEFDTVWHLLGFNNGVLDLQTDTFRDYQRNDFISISTGYDYKEPNPEDTQLLNHLINEIFPMEDERNLYKEIVCTSLEGRTLEKFIVFNGSGRNGKGLLNDILLKALGNHAYVLKNTVLTSETKNGPNPELANLEKKRLVIAREPQGRFNNSVIKEMTGGSVLNARFNHSNRCKVNLQLTLIVECNTKPKFTEDISDGEANRLIDILFRCHYTEDKTMVDASNFIYEANREYKNEEFQDRMKRSMINILRDQYKKYRSCGFKFNIPDTIKHNTMNYLKNSSDFISWFNDTYERSENTASIVTMQDIFETYRQSDEYCKLDRNEKRRMTKQYMIDLFSKNVMFRKFYRERYQADKANKYNVLRSYARRVVSELQDL